MDVIKLADYIIDIGPGKGEREKVVAKGTPEEIADNKKSYRKVLKKNWSNGFNKIRNFYLSITLK
jgi:excinuclease ABC subunit A